jgi:hypothetical protein
MLLICRHFRFEDVQIVRIATGHFRRDSACTLIKTCLKDLVSPAEETLSETAESFIRGQWVVRRRMARQVLCLNDILDICLRLLM